jgi:hypothetical protein
MFGERCTCKAVPVPIITYDAHKWDFGGCITWFAGVVADSCNMRYVWVACAWDMVHQAIPDLAHIFFTSTAASFTAISPHSFSRYCNIAGVKNAGT